MGLAFLAAASPLLVRNVLVYGSPLHHWNNRLVWIDRLPDYAEIYAPRAFERLPHGFLDWTARTSWHEIWFGRGAMGIAETAVHLGDSMSFVAPSPLCAAHIPGVALGFALMIIALTILWRSRQSFGRTFLLVQSAFFIAFFFFFSVAGGSSRYVFPMTLCLYAVLAAALAERPRWLARWAVAGALCAVLALALDPFPREIRPGYEEAGAWSQFEPEWFLPRENPMLIVSSVWGGQPLQPAELLPWFRSHEARYVILDSTSHKDGAPRTFFFDHAAPPHELRTVFSAGSLRILEVLPESRGPVAARAQ